MSSEENSVYPERWLLIVGLELHCFLSQDKSGFSMMGVRNEKIINLGLA